MMTEFRLPELGENVSGGDVSRVLVKVGDGVKEGQALMELETDKAAIEVPSPVAGVIREVKVKAGSKAKVGEVIFVIEGGTTAAAPEIASSKPAISSEPQAPAQAPAMPVAPPAQEKAPPAQLPPVATAVEEARPLVAAAPSVRRLAREIGVEISEVTGTGPAGRISEDDVKAYAKQRLAQAAKAGLAGQIRATALPDFSHWGKVERKEMTAVRRKTAEHMAQAWATVPQVTQFDNADTTELERLRHNFAKKVERAGGKLTVTAILLKVAASALEVFPQFNASLDMERNEIVYKKYCNIGVAVDTDRGLLVPVIRDVDRKNILELSVELAQMAEKARNKKLTLEEMQGGNFTITNLGGIGGTNFSPIVNWPEVAILGVARASSKPVYVDGVLEPRTILPLSLSYDHRIIDGADGARFLRWVAEALAQPFLLSLEG